MISKTKYMKKALAGTLMFLTALLGTACQEDKLGMEGTGKKELTSITFHIEGMEGKISTRAGNVTGLDIFSKYAVKLYLFKEDKYQGTTEPNNPYPNATLVEGYPMDINNPSVTITGLDVNNFNYCYAFVACEEAYADKLVAKAIDPDSYSAECSEAKSGSLYTNCFLQVLDEVNMSPFDKAEKAEDYFMVYGYGGGINTISGDIDFYTPVSVVLKRQMGAVVFSTADVGQLAKCTVFTEFYRLYLSQMVEFFGAGTRNHSHCGYFVGTDNPNDSSNPYADGDYSGSVLYDSNFSKTFESGSSIGNPECGEAIINGYVMYLPCTTTQGEENVPTEQKANVSFNYVDNIATSIEIGGKTYSTSSPFPIFPNRRTILTIGDDSQLNVSFGDGNGINYEEDWNGGVVNQTNQ